MFDRSLASLSGLFRHLPGCWLVLACALLLLAAWLAPSEWHAWSGWFPLWLHLVVEVFTTTLAGLVFAVTWHSHREGQSLRILALGCAFLGIGLVGLLHALSYPGMPDLVTPASTEKGINFWLVTRLLLALALLGLAFLPSCSACRKPSRLLLLGGVLGFVVVASYLGLAAPERWPRTFVQGVGLTRSKIDLEWFFIGLMLLAALGFWRERRNDLPFDPRGLLAATLLLVLAGLCFTRYTQVHGLYSLLGHLFNLLAFALIYRVVFVSCVNMPYRRLEAEIQERLAAERRIEQISFYDALTGLPSRALLRDRTMEALASAPDDRTQVALLFLDLDHFKMINDALGHAQGDRLLCELSCLLVDAVPTTATVCRVGGDEFAVLLPGLPEPEFAAVVVERVMEQLATPQWVGQRDILSSASVGVAISPGDGEDFETLVCNAETAMYTAKKAGRNAWRFYNPAMNATASERLELTNGLRCALEQDQLELYYQLQVDLFSGQVIGAEALLRWHHPQWGLVSPARFIPIAEESGLIVPIGAWILQQACHQAAQWQAEGLGIPVVAVNISALQLQDSALAKTVRAALDQAGLAPSALELELTESGLIQDSEQVRATVDQLKGLGVGLAIDDFGTGYSCLAYLRRLAVDVVKIDQSFVRDLNSSADGSAIVTAIIQMARSLGLEVLAEGVEDEETAEALRQLGCCQAQGYLYARPMPASALPARLAERRAAGAV
ncbi:putative bifunctional diguanylate cyclase/phosphodiesterase [Stutzerimonas tarimensis]|uniref:Bifunctional diguanylate cyclase/phosphodiesterase n=1 Tax=Stutzerimonas tarimensis TaxID=1507735 RepID=A0ABV7T2Z1_9GAMM